MVDSLNEITECIQDAVLISTELKRYSQSTNQPINHSIINDWYGFEKHLANSYLDSSQKKQGS